MNEEKVGEVLKQTKLIEYALICNCTYSELDLLQRAGHNWRSTMSKNDEVMMMINLIGEKKEKRRMVVMERKKSLN